jgi:uncharacterized protein DUF4085
MRYFTPDLIDRFGSSDSAVANAADEEWEALNEQYESYLRQIEPQLPAHVREFNDLRLHDARVYSVARHGDQLLLVLHKDIPPRDLVILRYTLTEEPFIDREALPAPHRSPVMDFLYDEFELIQGGEQPEYAQAILFGNGWEMRLRFRDVKVIRAEPLYSVPSAVQAVAQPA